MASDWGLLRRKYPTLPDDATYEQVKQAVRDYYRTYTLGDLAEARQEREDQKDKHARIVACVQAEMTVLDELVIDALEKAGADSVRTTRGVTFRKDSTIDAKIQPDGGAEKLRAWLEEHDMREMLSVHGAALSKVVRDRLDNEQELPDGVDAVPRNKLRVTGRANKDK